MMMMKSEEKSSFYQKKIGSESGKEKNKRWMENQLWIKSGPY